MGKKQRPILRYHGGKWRIAPWIIAQFPSHRIYVEPFGGAGSVLLRKPRTYSEVYNDLDNEVVNLFKIVRGRGPELEDVLRLTPYSRIEYENAWDPCNDPLEQARRTVIRSFMGFASAAVTLGPVSDNNIRNKNGALQKTGFRANSNRAATTPAHDWKNYPDCLKITIERLKGVVIENRDALKVMSQHDSNETLHYLDPPYLPETRDKGSDYRFEMTRAQHIDLADFVLGLVGKVIISGYDSDLYSSNLYPNWHKIERHSFADGGNPRKECLWMNFDPTEIPQPSGREGVRG